MSLVYYGIYDLTPWLQKGVLVTLVVFVKPFVKGK